jgi:L-ascorbate metabolism protein UlaG (beta-lactamase superfamily)
MTEARLTTAAAPFPARRTGAAGGAALSAWWLGQAGFLLEAGPTRLVVDPYLSDTLAAKYRGKPFPHVRMMPVPLDPAALREVDLVLASHGHTDHLDPGTLAPLAAANPACRFVVPAAHAALAVSRGVPGDRLVPARAFEVLEVAGVRIHPLPSAHEDLAMDAAGQHLFLGYVLELPDATVYHPGDCVPYPELPARLSRHQVDLALLPVNGRDARRAAGGVPGNFTLEEAMELADDCRFGAVIGHHFGMFDFNTIDTEAARARIAARPELPTFLLAELGARYDLWPRTRRAAEARGTIAP